MSDYCIVKIMGACWGSLSKDDLNVGSALDRVISQASSEDECILYKLANYKKGGDLVDAYNKGGQLEVEKLIREQFAGFMYRDGIGQVINRSEYLRWRFRSQSQVILPIEACLSRYDPLGKWTDHEACWKMMYRGSLGETLLHVLIMCDSKLHTKLARTLLKCFPRLAIDCVEGEEYLGASALHLAIAYNNNEVVQELVEAGALVNQRAIGSFFLPKDQQRRRPSKTTDYEGLAYLGEYPLSWAACCANESVYNLLLDNGAHPDLQDTFGNMILHMVVVCDKLDMFGYALRHPKTPASNEITNKAGLTPLTLACKLGRASVFREMLELSAREFWRYSNITCSAYPLNALDTLLPDGRTNWNSALFIILNGTKEEHLDMLDGGIIQRLLEEKWKTFARRQFIKRLAILFLHLFMLSMAVYLRPTDQDEPLLGGNEWQDIMRYSFEIGTVCGVLSYILIQQGGEMMNQGILSFVKQMPNEPAKAIFLISNILILVCIPFRLTGDKQTEEAILVFAVPASWFLLMFFAGAVRLTGPFVTMVYLMITGDMLTFGIIYSIVIVGFSQAFYFLYKGSPGASSSLYGSYPSTWMALFQRTLGEYNYAELGATVYPTLSKAVFTIFMILVPILLLNMLIAMMGNTYARVIEQSEKEWVKQWAKIVVALERAVNQKDAKRYLQEYSIKLGPGDDPSTEQRGVMVIKSKSKTRAKQRKGAVSNWKRVGKVTISELRKRRMTGEQLRRIMWGRESISTPVKAPPLRRTPESDFKEDDTSTTKSSTFSGAFTAALDVMAFAHDLDLSGSKKKFRNLRKKSSDMSQALSGMSGTETEITKDPFRQLVLCADDPKAKENELSHLAVAAAACVETSKVAEVKHEIKDQESRISKQESITFTLERSDSDGITSDRIPLGQQSRARKAKSAQAYRRNLNIPDVTETRYPNTDSTSTSSSDFSFLNVNQKPTFHVEQYKTEFTSQQQGHPGYRERPKTAKANRVAPTPELPFRRGTSAATTKIDEKGVKSILDPLEPWSIKGIRNMNAILAWEESEQESIENDYN